jgi:rifampicin phosphotransferase
LLKFLIHNCKMKKLLCISIFYSLASLSFAQMAQKPSGYRYQERAVAARLAPKNLDRDQVLQAGAKRPWLPDEALPKTYQAGFSSLNELQNRAEFDRVARVYDPGTVLEMPHVLFLVDMQDGNRVDFIHSRQYIFHEDYIRARYAGQKFSRAQINTNYEQTDRRFMLGTLSWQNSLQKWTYELWAGDVATASHIQLLQRQLSTHFFAPVSFKANSTAQERVGVASAVPLVTQAQVIGELKFVPLNQGKAVGRLRLAQTDEQISRLQPQDIAVLAELPLALPPIAGVVSASPSTVLSHVNVLAKSWNIPNAFVYNAPELLKALDGRWVRLQVTRTGYVLEAASQPNSVKSAKVNNRALVSINTSRQQVMPLQNMRRKDNAHCGAKAANLGSIQAAISAGKVTDTSAVPDGFCIPFAHYVAFMAQPAVRQSITQTLAMQDKVLRQQTLAQLQTSLLDAPVSAQHSAQWLQAWREQLQSAPVFARSSSNAEDLPGFSGAGMFSTVPNVTEEAALVSAVKQVWLSTLNWEALQALQSNGFKHSKIAMSVFVQKAVAAQSSGVMVTRDPFEKKYGNASYISAKRGLGIRVVEGKRVAEQVLFDRRSGAVQLLSLSADDKALLLDASGGVKEVDIPLGEAVLNDALVRRLDSVGLQLKKLFDNKDQDIEWATDDKGQLVILQSRPYAVN